MTYIMSCVWLDYMVKYFQCKNCVGSSLKTKKCVASFLVPGDRNQWLASPVISRVCGLFLFLPCPSQIAGDFLFLKCPSYFRAVFWGTFLLIP